MKFFVGRVGFDQFAEPRATALRAIETRFRLPADQVDALIAAGSDGVRENPTVQAFLRSLGQKPRPPKPPVPGNVPVALVPNGPTVANAAEMSGE